MGEHFDNLQLCCCLSILIVLKPVTVTSQPPEVKSTLFTDLFFWLLLNLYIAISIYCRISKMYMNAWLWFLKHYITPFSLFIGGCFIPTPSKFSRTPRRALGTLVGVFEWQHLCINQFSGRITKVATGDSGPGGRVDGIHWIVWLIDNFRVDGELRVSNGLFHSLAKQWFSEFRHLDIGMWSQSFACIISTYNIFRVRSIDELAIRMNPLQLLSDADQSFKKFHGDFWCPSKSLGGEV